MTASRARVRVAMDLRTLLFTRAGISRFVGGLLEALRREPSVEIVPLTVPRLARPFWSPRLECWWEERWAPRRVARAACDVVHGTRYWVPRVNGVRAVATVYDLSFETVPDTYPPEARAYFAARLREALDRADVIVTMSEFVKRGLVSRHGVAEDRVAVVLPGRPRLAGSGDRPPAGAPGGGRYVLAVGTVEPRKNYPALVAALASVRSRLPDVSLRIVGRSDRGRPAVEDAIRRHRLDGAVLLMGEVDDAALAGLYRGAAVVAVPSLDEGFGFTALEGMANGRPVIVSDRGSLPEVVGDAGLVTAPAPEPLAGALLKVLEDPALAARLGAAGADRAAGFTWERAAAQLVAAYDLARA